MGRATRKSLAGSGSGARGSAPDLPLALALAPNGPLYQLEEHVRAAPGSRRRQGMSEVRPEWISRWYPQELQKIKDLEERGEDTQQRERLGVQEVPLDALYPLMEHNREFRFGPHSRDSALLESIREHGVIQPLHVLYNPQTGQAFINEGNHRLGLARLAELETVPVHVVPTIEDYRARPGVGASVPLQPTPAESPGCTPESPEGPFSPAAIGLAAEDQHRARNRELYRRQQQEAAEKSVDTEKVAQARALLSGAGGSDQQDVIDSLKAAGLLEVRPLQDSDGKKLTSPCGSGECQVQGLFLPDGSGLAETYCASRGTRALGQGCGKAVSL